MFIPQKIFTIHFLDKLFIFIHIIFSCLKLGLCGFWSNNGKSFEKVEGRRATKIIEMCLVRLRKTSLKYFVHCASFKIVVLQYINTGLHLQSLKSDWNLVYSEKNCDVRGI